jgi:hypothetical protein
MKLSETIEKEKRKMADYLNRISEKVSLQTKKRIFAAVGILISCICLAMIVEPFRNPISDQGLISTETRLPVVIAPPVNNNLYSQEDYVILLNFRQMMDSLKRYDRNTYDEVLNGRKGLMDSIDFLISLYR